MKIRSALSFFRAAACVCTCIIVAIGQPSSALAQATAAESWQSPRTPNGKPDFSGFWSQPTHVVPRPGGATTFTKEKMPPFVPGGEALFYKLRTGDPRLDEPRAFCQPSGFPSAFLGPYPVQIVQTDGWLVMTTEFERATRLIPLDGRAHREDIEPTYYGDSVGHWEGDMLVIDSRNYKRWTLDDHYYQAPDEYRMHSDAFRTIERLRRVDADTLSYAFTVEDPKIFTESWTEDLQMKLHPEWEAVGLYEFVCQENNRCPGGECSGQ
jgi:hypothetical protein